jgi:hypothetical protein
MDIEKLLTRAADYCDMAINSPPRYLLAERIAFAQIADACANTARAMIEFERWQEERATLERNEILAQREVDESPF